MYYIVKSHKRGGMLPSDLSVKGFKRVIPLNTVHVTCACLPGCAQTMRVEVVLSEHRKYFLYMYVTRVHSHQIHLLYTSTI